MKHISTMLLAAAMVGTAFAPSLAGAQYVRVRPPRPMYERRPPAPRPGWAWRAGYQRWDGARYVWVPGGYMAPPRPRAYWVQGRWVHGPRGWSWREGYWR